MKIKSSLFAASAMFFIGLPSAQAVVVLSDTFSYSPAGAITTRSGTPWVTHSGTAGQVDVTGTTVNLTQSEGEDVNATFTGSPYTVGIFTATFTVNFSGLPSSTAGGYFAHFKDSTASGFRSRIVANTTGAASGLFRLGISNAGGSAITTTNVATDLSLGTTYNITMTWNLDTLASTLAVNGGSAVSAPDTATALAITSFGLRQASGIGILTMDNLSVDYIPEPNAAALLGVLGMFGILRRRR